MANIFKPKRSDTASSVPTTGNLDDGELAVNSSDGIIYLRVAGDIKTVANYLDPDTTINYWAESGGGIRTDGSVGIGTTTASGTVVLDVAGDSAFDGPVYLKNQNGNPNNLAEHGQIFAKDVASSTEVHVRDEAGNVTLISPHNDVGEWIYFSENVYTGKRVRVNMEKMILKLQEITGETFFEEYNVP